MLKHSRLYSVFFNKCPRCHKGDFFVNNSAYWPLKGFDKMHKNCSHCNEPLTPEPGFYYGAMYLSYGFYAGIILVSSLIAIKWLNIDVMRFIMFLVPALIVLTPLIFRMARRTWLTIFVSYSPEKSEVGANG